MRMRVVMETYRVHRGRSPRCVCKHRSCRQENRRRRWRQLRLGRSWRFQFRFVSGRSEWSRRSSRSVCPWGREWNNHRYTSWCSLGWVVRLRTREGKTKSNFYANKNLSPSTYRWESSVDTRDEDEQKWFSDLRGRTRLTGDRTREASMVHSLVWCCSCHQWLNQCSWSTTRQIVGSHHHNRNHRLNNMLKKDREKRRRRMMIARKNID